MMDENEERSDRSELDQVQYTHVSVRMSPWLFRDAEGASLSRLGLISLPFEPILGKGQEPRNTLFRENSRIECCEFEDTAEDEGHDFAPLDEYCVHYGTWIAVVRFRVQGDTIVPGLEHRIHHTVLSIQYCKAGIKERSHPPSPI